MYRRLSLLLMWGLVLSSALVACDASKAATQPTSTVARAKDATSTPVTPIKAGDIHLQRFATGLTNPVYLTYAPGQTDRVYVVEKTGVS